jgi:hypothetical protein
VSGWDGLKRAFKEENIMTVSIGFLGFKVKVFINDVEVRKGWRKWT